MRTVLVRSGALALAVGLVAACGGDDRGTQRDSPSVVVTTSVLGDVVRELVGPDVEVEVVIPAGTEAHAFAPSPKQALAMREADVLIANGRGLEEGLVDTIGAADRDGATVIEVTDYLDEPNASDPHFFTDPVRMGAVVAGLEADLARALDIDAAELAANVRRYAAELEQLDDDIAALLEVVPSEHRLLVTAHNVVAYFAERYRFEVDSIALADEELSEPGAARLAELASTIRSRGLPAIFVEEGGDSRLVDAVATEAGDVEVVALYGEALGPAGSGADTYITMLRTNAERIAEALS